MRFFLWGMVLRLLVFWLNWTTTFKKVLLWLLGWFLGLYLLDLFIYLGLYLRDYPFLFSFLNNLENLRVYMTYEFVVRLAIIVFDSHKILFSFGLLRLNFCFAQWLKLCLEFCDLFDWSISLKKFLILLHYRLAIVIGLTGFAKDESGFGEIVKLNHRFSIVEINLFSGPPSQETVINLLNSWWVFDDYGLNLDPEIIIFGD